MSLLEVIFWISGDTRPYSANWRLPRLAQANRRSLPVATRRCWSSSDRRTTPVAVNLEA